MNTQDRLPQEVPFGEGQGLCDIVGKSFALWRQNIGLIFSALFVPTLFLVIGNCGIQWCATVLLEGARIPGVILCLSGFLGVIITFVAFLVFSVRVLAFVRLFCGFAPTWAQALDYCQKKFWWLSGLYLIYFLLALSVCALAIFFVTALFLALGVFKGNVLAASVSVLFGVLACGGLVFTICGFFLTLFLAQSVLSCEEIGFWLVLGRAWQLTWQNFGRVFCFGVVVSVVLLVVEIPASIPAYVLLPADIFMRQLEGGDIAKPSFVALLLLQVWQALVEMVLRPIVHIAFGLFYLDLRQRTEGLDLKQRLQMLQAKLV